MGLKIIKGDNSVSICEDCNHELESFIDIYVDDYDTPSLFRSIESAYDFAVIIVKLLEAIHEFK